MGVRFTRSGLVSRGKAKEATAFAAQISEYIKENLGVPVTWGMEIGGTLGTMHWHVDYTDMAQLEKALGWTMTDEGYQKLIDDAIDLFDGAPTDTIIYTM